MRLLVTGGCGFVGSNFIRYILNHYDPEFITNVDALTCASSLSTTAGFPERFGDHYEFVQADIADANAMEQLFSAHTYFAVVNFAAESQLVPRVKSSRHLVHSNIVGTNVLLEAARSHGVKRFVQVSTDEVYGSAEEEEEFTEASALCPSSPYSASKAAADLLALSCHRTYGQDVVITRSSNNYGPYQHPEKLIPVAIISALRGEKVPIYGDGRQQRDWIHVEDHCNALFTVLLNARAGEIYNVCSGEQWANLDLVLKILAEVGAPPTLVQRVADRPSHDRRYRLSGRKLREELGWKPLHSLDADLPQTIQWYRQNQSWWTAALQAHASGC